MGFEIIPVVDLLGGLVVRGVAGKRHLYRPLNSPLVTDGDFAELMENLRHEYGFSRCYMADLDAIQRHGDNFALIKAYCDKPDSMELILDAGVSTATDAPRIMELGVSRVIIGSETLGSIADLDELVRLMGKDRIVLSVDIMQGELLYTAQALKGYTVKQLLSEAAAMGVRDFFLLQLNMVGTGQGLDKALIRECLVTLGTAQADTALWLGGGVSSLEDLSWLEHEGVQGAFVASILHNGVMAPSL